MSILDLGNTTVGASTGTGPFQGDKLPLPRFSIFQKADLTIQLERTSNDSFSELKLFYRFYDYGISNYWINPSDPKPHSSITYNVTAPAGKQTTVHWIKKLPSGATETRSETITISPIGTNVITITY